MLGLVKIESLVLVDRGCKYTVLTVLDCVTTIRNAINMRQVVKMMLMKYLGNILLVLEMYIRKYYFHIKIELVSFAHSRYEGNFKML